MLAWYVEWHMRQRTTPVEKTRPSPSGKRKTQTRETPDGLRPVHPHRRSRQRRPACLAPTTIVTRRTRLQSRAFEFPEVNPNRTMVNEFGYTDPRSLIERSMMFEMWDPSVKDKSIAMFEEVKAALN